jgi:nitrate reductase gamma subunit
MSNKFIAHFIKVHTGRVDYLALQVVASTVLGFVLLYIGHSKGITPSPYSFSVVFGLMVGQIIIVGSSLFIKRRYLDRVEDAG